MEACGAQRRTALAIPLGRDAPLYTTSHYGKRWGTAQKQTPWPGAGTILPAANSTNTLHVQVLCQFLMGLTPQDFAALGASLSPAAGKTAPEMERLLRRSCLGGSAIGEIPYRGRGIERMAGRSVMGIAV